MTQWYGLITDALHSVPKRVTNCIAAFGDLNMRLRVIPQMSAVRLRRRSNLLMAG